MDDELIKIDLEDIQDLVIYKKFVRINSDKYTDEAFNYVKYLVDNERAILFDADKHRIYTLGEYYGGDELKENLLYFSKILSIDIDNNILSEIDALQNSDTLAITGKGALHVNLYHDNYNTIELEYKLNEIINNNPFKFNSKNEYNFYIDENGKIALNEYIYPEVIINNDPIESNVNEILDIKYDIKTSIDLNNWDFFNISYEDCEIINEDKENKILKVKFFLNKTGKIIFEYSDGKNQDTYIFNQYWSNICVYGLYNGEIYEEIGNFKFNDDNIYNIIINQDNNKYAYIILPKFINPIFIDNIYNIQGAWHKVYDNNITDLDLYNVYITDNSGLGKIEWKIINKKI